MANRTLEKIDIAKIDPKNGFDAFEQLRNGGALDEQKVSAVIQELVDQHNNTLNVLEQLAGIIKSLQGKKSAQKGALKNTSTKS